MASDELEIRQNVAPPDVPKPVTSAYLERAALHYLERYSASVSMLRRTLARRVQKRCRLRGEDPAAFADLVEATVTRAVSAGLVDDSRFTEARIASLRRRGASSRAVSAKLSAKGIAREIVAAALERERDAAEEGDGAAIEEDAARAYARRRRLGPWRQPHLRSQQRDRDLAAMARAGFPYSLASRIVDAEPAADDE
ncbi:MAG: RecX family transcriptional regulator [Methylobacterium sp.]|uniref:regulatory protein RecX n=1 Tax=Methylobacterium sp. TaxID=409 RepID=UPI0025D91EF1|nr:RecX family transcriptional regulator [Methylobacterium sp.]MBX9934587.1 RecX family transcriptional regulator [Methylobacterium sp.]